MATSVPQAILEHYQDLRGMPQRPWGSGLINHTFLVEGRKGPVIVQKLHRIFAGVVNVDIEHVTAHLQKKGITTPRPVRADDDRLWVEDDEERAWRALTFVQGESFDRVTSAELAYEAGKLVATFHAAVADLDYAYKHVRKGVHDTNKHLRHLEDALREHPSHRLFPKVEALGGEILRQAERLADLSAFPERHSHGDLKISNLLFRDQKGVCLVDLDTLSRMKWPHEMGDALRSWCNPAGEDASRVAIDKATFRAALSGYGEIAKSRGFLTSAEAEAIVDGLATICLELASRFLADALFENYFGYDAQRFPARGEHNLLRAEGQLALFASVLSERDELRRIAHAALR